MFNFLSGSQAKLELALDKPTGPYYPGDTIHATVTLQGQNPLDVQEARVTFAYSEEYTTRRRARMSRRVRHGNQVRTEYHETEQTATLTDERELAREMLFAPGALPAPVNRTSELSFTVPQDAPPAFEGKIVKVHWLLRAQVAVKNAQDLHADVAVPVAQVAPGQHLQPGEFSERVGLDEATGFIWLPRQEWRGGETIEGKVVIKPTRDFDATAVRGVILRREQVSDELGHTVNEADQPVQIAGTTKFRAGQTYELPFRLPVPTVPSGTFSTPHSAVAWSAQVILDRRLHADSSISAPVFVYSAA